MTASELREAGYRRYLAAKAPTNAAAAASLAALEGRAVHGPSPVPQTVVPRTRDDEYRCITLDDGNYLAADGKLQNMHRAGTAYDAVEVHPLDQHRCRRQRDGGYRLRDCRESVRFRWL